MHQQKTPLTRHISTRRIGFAGIAVAVLAAAGCSGEDIAERVVENRIEAESGEDVDIDLDDGNVRVETDEGTFEMNADGDGNVSIEGSGDDGDISINSGGASVPDDFPGSVPLPDGFEPQFSQSVSSTDGDGWILSGALSGSTADVAESYLSALEAAGFEQQQRTETPDSVVFTYDDGTYSVIGLIGDDGSGGTTFNVTVAASQG